MDNNYIGIIQINHQGVIDFASEAISDIIQNEDSIIGAHVTDVFPNCIFSQNVYETKTQLVDIKYGRLLLSSIILPDADRSNKTLVFIQNLEQSKKAEDLYGSNISIGEMETLFEIVDNMAIADGEGVFLRVSHSWEEVHGVKKEEILGKSAFDMEREGIFAPSVTVKVLKDKKKTSLVQKNKLGRTLVSTAVPIFNTRREIEYVVSWDAMDVTNFVKLNDEYELLQNILQRQSAELRELRLKDIQYSGIIAKSDKMKNVLNLASKVADVDTTLIITGESGVGKNLIAKFIHQHSARKDGPFIDINCGAIPESLIESELFGYERGSFTGANQGGKIGQIELTHGGTLFLDEVAELPLNMQVKLLKVIQEKKISKVGGKHPVDVDFRLIAATNKDLSRLVREGLFREDLFYRLNVIPIHIPPLRERPEDILSLALYFVSKTCDKYKKEKSLSQQAVSILMNFDWPGNVRELENVIERVVLLSDNNSLGIEDFREYIASMPAVLYDNNLALKPALEVYEKELLKKAVKDHKTTIGIAKALAISQPSVVRKLKKYNLRTGLESW